MAFNTKSIVKDVNQKPVPQYYNPTSDVYEVLQGKNGANKVILYNEAGAAIDLSTLIATIVTAINTTGTVQLRTGTNNIGKVEVTASELPNGAATSVKQDNIIDHVDGIEALLTAIRDTAGIKKIADALPAGTNSIGKVILSTDERDLRGKAANKPAANTVPIGATYWSVDTDPHADLIEVSDGTSWVVI